MTELALLYNAFYREGPLMQLRERADHELYVLILDFDGVTVALISNGTHRGARFDVGPPEQLL